MKPRSKVWVIKRNNSTFLIARNVWWSSQVEKNFASVRLAMISAVRWPRTPAASTRTEASSKLQSCPSLMTISCCMMINQISRRDVWPMRSHCSCHSIAERTGTANRMGTGTATGMATAGTVTGVRAMGMGTGGDVDIVMGWVWSEKVGAGHHLYQRGASGNAPP